MCVKEFFRFYLVVLFGIFYFNLEVIMFVGYDIFVCIIVMINLWVIGCDLVYWDNFLEFNFDWFLGFDVIMFGRDF